MIVGMTQRNKTNNPIFTNVLPEKIKYWRTKKNDYGLHEAKAILGISIGYISDLENGKLEMTMNVFRKYHEADPDLFPLTDASLLI